ncbi:PadR family transcriptional regulator [Pseudobacteroides cellulosolvens]|uniref:Transcriptional regulator, PadR-like family n=1 Tax=Pseudobacteroides cellulosolvens ATCC 35603 = DSM 2933 TaxID=398512 RepID=A0A0L6JUC4_9FIRM|nr:PadR family transcriptional regulator [Pseudobacteroides cellulosolvens]KNY29319.1 transcriptional regulator, PadR-like family [Pseudobacteroides cellulosolvens ATCC 35603 = DSM 2933]
MAIKNKTRYAILGVISMKPCSGYDIKKFCDKTISHFWNENFGHIYPVLSQLEKEGLINLSDSSEGCKRKIYEITDKGRKEFCEWLMQPFEPQPPRSELLLKLSFGNYIPKENVIEMMKEVKKIHESKLKEYKQMEESFLNDENAKKHPQYAYWLAPLRYGIVASEAALKWCEETIENIIRHE